MKKRWLVAVITVVTALITSIAINLISTRLITQKQPEFITLTSILVAMLAVVVVFIASFLFSNEKPDDNKKRDERVAITVQASEINNSLKDLIDLERNRSRSEKARIDSEREEQIAEWQDEALELVLVSPEAAVLVAWKGVEKALQYTNRQIRIYDRTIGDGEFLQESVSLLEEQGILDRVDAVQLYNLKQRRNRVVSGVEKEKVTPHLALEYIKQAAQISSELLHTFRERQENLA